MVATKNSNEILCSTEVKRNGFHAKYLEICKSKNLMPLPEVKTKNRNIHELDFHADRVKSDDWIAICKALQGDKTLKFVAIRLRKNNLLILNEADNLKKAKAIASHPVIYTKFLFEMLVDALKHLLANNSMLETLIIEGLPLNEIFMEKFILGLTRNSSVKCLSFNRSTIGDSSCDTVCTALKLLMNVETLNFSGCFLGVKGAEAIAGLIKLQKISRYSEAWNQSLRYQNVDAESFPGLRKILLNNNPEVGDEGLEFITEVLLEDVWIKDIEMQNCGLTDQGAQSIVKCLNANKTILNFNIAGNSDLSEHLHRHIIVHLGNADQDTTDSSSSGSTPRKVTKTDLIEEVSFLKEKLEQEIYRRKQMELLHDKLEQQVSDCQKRLMIQGAFQVPEGFTLVANNTLNELLKEKSDLSRVSSIHSLRNRRKRRHVYKVHKSSSCFAPKTPMSVHIDAPSKSETFVNSAGGKIPFIERNIGDHIREVPVENSMITGAELLKRFTQKNKESTPLASIKPLNEHGDGDFRESRLMSREDVLQSFSRQPSKSPKSRDSVMHLPIGFDPRSLFSNSANLVPVNSDVDSDD